ncbi:hypothetical protein BT63DRAFT_482311 [Microthyrium microscopicum]|uniref:JmjC domain-containing protein n=1 Tax=Microthyrium microscopicum TaxID=703497 RepID=A0A6A6U175_9PEZI|nr:hypothetical protein BT63DRAFT_482311 [Microthyrium microscopicum]
MPAQRPRASFEPISTDLDINQLVEETPNFEFCNRLSFTEIERSPEGLERFERMVREVCINKGLPLVIDGFEEKLDAWAFTPKWLIDNHGSKVENARNLTQKDNIAMTIKHYLSHMGKLTEQFFEGPENYKDKSRQRVYLKDIDCPQVWQDKLKDIIPGAVFYFNDSTGLIGGPGALNDPLPHATGPRKGKGIGIAGDLMSSLPLEMRAENLMCYIGHEGTYTPAHREMCATMSHNIMVNTSGDVDENGNPERPGSSIWFMTQSKDRKIVAEWWQSTLGHDIELEDHFAQIAAWQRAPFTTYVVEQKLGDFVLIPPLAPHQVWNRGTRTMKVAWNRTTVETLEFAMHEALPKSRMVCRDEQYKNKAIIYYTLMKYSSLIKQAEDVSQRSESQRDALARSKKYRQVQRDFIRLFELFKEVLLAEMFAPGSKESCELLTFDSNVTCSYCRANIFNRFLTCKHCNDKFGGDDPYDVCMDCYVIGRSCECRSKYKWVEQFKWKHLQDRYEYWREQIIKISGGMTGRTPYQLEEERRLYPKKTTAQVCQEQLRIRPWIDIKKETPPTDDEEDGEEEVTLNNDGTIKKVTKKKTKSYFEKNKSCHVCLSRHPKWTMAMCTMCEKYWCYGSLYRAFDLLPQMVLEDPNWECPHCQRICSAGNCRKDPRQQPYVPNGTSLGHDTKKVADIRSVECLVDFGVSNLNWAANDGSQFERLQAEQETMNQTQPQDHSGDEMDLDGPRIAYSPNAMIDPALAGDVPDTLEPLAPPEQPLISNIHEYPDPSTTTAYPDIDNSGYDLNVTMYHGPGTVDTSTPAPVNGSSNTNKRPAADMDPIKIVQRKRKRKANDEEEVTPNRNKASKQFQQEQHKKQLDQARKEGRYLYVWAKLNNKSLKVSLTVPQAKLEELQSIDQEKQAKEQQRNNVLLRSDIRPPPLVVYKPVPKPSKPKSFKARLEEDEDFGARWRPKAGKQKKKQPQFEEIELENSSEDDFFYERAGGNRSSNRRKSDWLARKNQDEDEDIPEELPQDYKDRAPGTRSSLNGRRSLGQKAPRIRPTGGSNNVDLTNVATSESEDEDDTSAAAENTASKAAEVARLAMEEENRQAKLQALHWAEDGEDDDDAAEQDGTEGDEEDELFAAKTPTPQRRRAGPASASNSPAPTSNSARAGPSKSPAANGESLASRMAGRNIKIVAAKTKKFFSKSGPPGRSQLPG